MNTNNTVKLPGMDSNKEQIIQEFKELLLHIDNLTENEINNTLSDITKKVRKLYRYDRDDRSYQ